MESLQGSMVLWIDGFNYDKAKYQNKDNKMMAWAMNFFFSYHDATHQRCSHVL